MKALIATLILFISYQPFAKDYKSLKEKALQFAYETREYVTECRILNEQDDGSHYFATIECYYDYLGFTSEECTVILKSRLRLISFKSIFQVCTED